jgi:hypothetical protein
MGVVSFSALAINSDASRTVRRAPVIQAVKQTVQLSRESTHRHGSRATFNTCYRLVKVYRTYHQPLQHRVKRVKAVETKDNIKPISGSQCMKTGSIKASDQCLSIGR